MYCLEYAINGGVWRCRHTVPQECSIPSLEENTKSSPEVESSLSLWPVQQQASSPLYPPLDANPPGKEGNLLLLTILCCSSNLLLKGEGEGVTSLCSCPSYSSNNPIFQCSSVSMFQCSNFPIFQCSNVLMFHWSIGPLIHWSIGSSVHWTIGPLVYWSIGLLVYGTIGPLVHWTIGLLVHWSICPLVH